MDEDFEVLNRTNIPSVNQNSPVDLQVIRVEYEDGDEGLILYEISMGNHLVEEKLKEKRTKKTEMVFLRHVFSRLAELFSVGSDSNYMYDVWKSMENYYLDVFNERNDSDFGELLFMTICDDGRHYFNVHIDRENSSIDMISSHDIEDCDAPLNLEDAEEMAKQITKQYKGYDGVRIAVANTIEEIEEEDQIDEEQF